MTFANNFKPIFLIAVIFISSWFMGGHHPSFFIFAIFFLVFALIFLVSDCFSDRASFFNPLILSSFIILFAIVWIGLNFFQFNEVHGAFESFYEYKSDFAYLPFGLYTVDAWKNALILLSSILVGFVAFTSCKNRASVRFILWAVFFNILILSVVGTFFKITNSQLILGKFVPPDARYFFASFTYKNHWSAYAFLSYLGTFGLAVYYHKNRRRWNLKNSPLGIFISMGFLIGLTTLMSGSRSGLIAFSLGFGISIWIGVKLVLENYTYLSSSSKYVLRLFLAFLPIPLFIGTVFVVSPKLLTEPLSVTEGQIRNIIENKQWESRVYSSRDTFRMFLARPWWGWGYNSFEIVFRKYFQGPELSASYLNNDETKSMYDNLFQRVQENASPENKLEFESFRSRLNLQRYKFAHNDILQYLAEIGIFGFCCLFMPVFYIFYKLIQLKQAIPSITKWILIAISFIVLYSMVEFPTRTPGILYLFTILIALGYRYACLERDSASNRRRSR
jgi:O-antigen ligase